MRKLKRAGALAFLFTCCLAPVAHGVPLDTYGTQSWRTKPPPKVVPSTHCTALPYAAFANPADAAVDAYMFSGWCNINVAPEGQNPVMQKLEVQVEAEWSPKMKRASERVKLVHPDKTVTFSTWATCDKDPFLLGAAAVCKDQGMGGQDFSMFIRREDAPLAESRVPADRVATFTSRVTSRAQLRQTGTIKSVELQSTELNVGKPVAVKTTFAGGPGSCPMQIDFGDGYVQQSFNSEQSTFDLASHPYTKPGTYTITARPLPGCSGKASVEVIVKGAVVEAIAGAGAPSRMGKTSGINLSGRLGTCKTKVDFGDGKSEIVAATFGAATTNKWIEHTYYEPGRKTLTATGLEGCSGSVTGFVDVAPAAIKSLKRFGAVPPFETFQATSDGGVCPLRIEWGDGTVEELKRVTFNNGVVTLSHQYKKKGKMLVSARGINGCVGVQGE